MNNYNGYNGINNYNMPNGVYNYNGYNGINYCNIQKVIKSIKLSHIFLGINSFILNTLALLFGIACIWFVLGLVSASTGITIENLRITSDIVVFGIFFGILGIIVWVSVCFSIITRDIISIIAHKSIKQQDIKTGKILCIVIAVIDSIIALVGIATTYSIYKADFIPLIIVAVLIGLILIINSIIALIILSNTRG